MAISLRNPAGVNVPVHGNTLGDLYVISGEAYPGEQTAYKVINSSQRILNTTAGRLYSIFVSTSGAGASVAVYDSAGATSTVMISQFPVSAPVLYEWSKGPNYNTGLYFAINSCTLSVFYEDIPVI